MNNYVVMAIISPKVSKRNLSVIQRNIVETVDKTAQIQNIYDLGKSELEYPIKKFKEGYHLKIDIQAKPKKIQELKETIKHNKNVIFSMVIQGQKVENILSKMLKEYREGLVKLPKKQQESINKKVYMLVSKNPYYPELEKKTLAMSDNKNKIMQTCMEEIKKYIYKKRYYTVKDFKRIRDIENELGKIFKVELFSNDNKDEVTHFAIEVIVLI